MTLIARKIVMISIHAPTRGATKDIEVDMLSSKISIHAPTRGATILQTSSRRSSRYFNPRSYKRSDITGGINLTDST